MEKAQSVFAEIGPFKSLSWKGSGTFRAKNVDGEIEERNEASAHDLVWTVLNGRAEDLDEVRKAIEVISFFYFFTIRTSTSF